MAEVEKTIKKQVKEDKAKAWKAIISITKNNRGELLDIIQRIDSRFISDKVKTLVNSLTSITEPDKKDVISTARKVIHNLNKVDLSIKTELINWINSNDNINYSDFFHY